MQKQIEKDDERSRYELRLEDRVVGEADYVREGDRLSITHTGVEPRLRGQGLAGELIEFALRDAQEGGLEVLPYCSYVADYIDKHPQYRELVPAEQRRRFGIGDN